MAHARTEKCLRLSGPQGTLEGLRHGPVLKPLGLNARYSFSLWPTGEIVETNIFAFRGAGRPDRVDPGPAQEGCPVGSNVGPFRDSPF